MPAFVHTKIAANGYRFIKTPAAAVDPVGFDTASARVLFRGSMAQFLAKFPIGGTSGDAGLPGAPAGSIMYCLGPQGEPEIKFGHIWGDIGWKGILATRNLASIPVTSLNANDHVQSCSLAMTSQESMWPLQQDGATIYLPPPYAPPTPPGGTPGLRTRGVVINGLFVPVYQAPWRIRLIGRAYSASVRGITVGDRQAIIRPPKCNIPDPTILDTGTNWQNLPDPLVTWSKDAGTSDGWVCRNYQRTSEYIMGAKILAFWNADYEWVERYGP